MKILIRISFIIAVIIFWSVNSNSEVTVKIKDLSFIDGLKENQVYGYGLVVGLQGTGDTKSPLTQSSLKNLLKNLGMEGDDIFSKNSAAVLLTAQLPHFVRIGDRIDITVSSIGDAKSLDGGILVQSPLKGADDVIYVVVQGPLSIPKSKGRRRGIKTVARIKGGGVVEREVIPKIVNNNSIHLVLKEWDYSLAHSIIKAVSKKYPESKPEMTGNGKIKINIVKDVSLPEFISTIQNIEITPKYKARIVINERNGTIVTGGNVKISEAMVSKDGLVVQIADSEQKGYSSVFKESSTVKDMVDALNSIGATTSDIIAILKALEEAGALHAELIVK